jgi:kynurenine formamidase
MSRIIDLTLTMRPGMHGVDFEARSTFATRGVQTTTLHLYSHAGTHLDAPRHFLEAGISLEALLLDKCIGPAHVIDLTFLEPKALITLEHLAPFTEKIKPGARLLFKTGWSARADMADYRTDFPRVSLALAESLAQAQISLLGVEPPSVADMANREELVAVHQTLLKAEIVIVEGLANLDALQQPEVTLIALPLKLEGLDGSPVRAIAIENEP